MNTTFESAFDRFVSSYIDRSNKENRGLITKYDADFPSPCFGSIENISIKNGSDVDWQPIRRPSPIDIDNTAQALNLEMHHDVHTLFSRYYSFDLNAATDRGQLTILQSINDDDFERLQKNLIAHVLMKRKLRQQETLFFALTDEDDFVLSLIPQTSEVVLEFIGKSHQETIASNLIEFFETLRPAPKEVEL